MTVLVFIGAGLVGGVIWGIAEAYLANRWLAAIWLILIGSSMATNDELPIPTAGNLSELGVTLAIFVPSTMITKKIFKAGRKK